MSPVASRLITAFVMVAYIATSIGPRGAALCLGGGHDWNEVIAARCAHGGHTHHGLTDHAHGSTDCTACDHHQHEDHGPCTDIPLDPDEARPGGAPSKAATDSPQFTNSPLSWLLPDLYEPILNQPPERCRILAWAPREVTASLRAVVLLI